MRTKYGSHSQGCACTEVASEGAGVMSVLSPPCIRSDAGGTTLLLPHWRVKISISREQVAALASLHFVHTLQECFRPESTKPVRTQALDSEVFIKEHPFQEKNYYKAY